MIRMLILEGADKVGKSTLIKDLKARLANEDINILVYNDLMKSSSKYTQEIKRYLNSKNQDQENKLTPFEQGLLFANAFASCKPNFQKIDREYPDQKTLVILDRSIISTYVYMLAQYLMPHITKKELENLDDYICSSTVEKHIDLKLRERAWGEFDAIANIRRLIMDYIDELDNKVLVKSLLFVKNIPPKLHKKRIAEIENNKRDIYEQYHFQALVKYLYMRYIQLGVVADSNKWSSAIYNTFGVNEENSTYISKTIREPSLILSNSDEYPLHCILQRSKEDPVSNELDRLLNVIKSKAFWS